MRLWSVHPRHLDDHQLATLWHRATRAKQQITKAQRFPHYEKSETLAHFYAHRSPGAAIEAYLYHLRIEAERRGKQYKYQPQTPSATFQQIPVGYPQLLYEARMLRQEQTQTGTWHQGLIQADYKNVGFHPVFKKVYRQGVEAWEPMDYCPF